MNRFSLRSYRALARVLLLTGSAFAALLGESAIQAQAGPEAWQVSGVAMGSSIASLPPSIFAIVFPEVVAWPDGTYRLYFGARRADGGLDLWYADSPDAMTFTLRGLVLAGTNDPCDPEFQVGGASLIHLADGRWRMYYQARQSGPPSPPNCTDIHFRLYSAISSDGVTFTREGVRISDAGHGRVLRLDSGGYVAIVGGQGGVVSFTSADGLTFGSPQLLPLPAGSHDPYAAKVGGHYVLYADTSLPETSSIPVLTSSDGLNWSATSTASFADDSGAPLMFGVPAQPGPADARGIADVGGVVLGDGTLRLYSDWNSTNFLSFRRIDGQTAPPPGANTNYEGLWWNAPPGSEAGWGINFAHQGSVIFATWFTYNFAGAYWWLSMIANEIANNLYSGDLYLTNGPAFNAEPFDPAQVTGMSVGMGTLYFSDANNGTFTYQIGGFTQTKHITREVFGPMPLCTWSAQPNLALATNYQDLWWAAPAGSESGWGVNLTQQRATIFGTWFTYDANHNPLWLSVTAAQTEPNTYTGTLYLTNGPAFNSVPFDPTQVTVETVGTATFSFSDGNNGTFAYNVDLGDGINKANQVKTITRQVFRTPVTVCQ